MGYYPIDDKVPQLKKCLEHALSQIRPCETLLKLYMIWVEWEVMQPELTEYVIVVSKAEFFLEESING